MVQNRIQKPISRRKKLVMFFLNNSDFEFCPTNYEYLIINCPDRVNAIVTFLLVHMILHEPE